MLSDTGNTWFDHFLVTGIAQSRGSKRPMIRYRDGCVVTGKSGHPAIAVVDSNRKSKGWMDVVSSHALAAMGGDPPVPFAVELSVRFVFARPKSHFRSGKNQHLLATKAKPQHTQKPDLGKLVRPIEDALSKIVYQDDCQIVSYGEVTKNWNSEGESYVEILVTRVPETETENGSDRHPKRGRRGVKRSPR